MVKKVVYILALSMTILMFSLTTILADKITVDGLIFRNSTGSQFYPRGNTYPIVDSFFDGQEHAGHIFSPILLYPAMNYTEDWNTEYSVVTLAPGFYNHDNMNANLSKMSQLGYNNVRIYVNGWYHTPDLVDETSNLPRLNNT